MLGSRKGVENPEQLSSLKTLGCDLAKGCYLGRPDAVEATTQRLTESSRTPA